MPISTLTVGRCRSSRIKRGESIMNAHLIDLGVFERVFLKWDSGALAIQANENDRLPYCFNNFLNII
jgi:hypothetical protein